MYESGVGEAGVVRDEEDVELKDEAEFEDMEDKKLELTGGEFVGEEV